MNPSLSEIDRALDRLAEVADAELERYEGALLAELERLADSDEDDLPLMEAAASAVSEIRGEAARRLERAAADRAARSEVLERVGLSGPVSADEPSPAQADEASASEPIAAAAAKPLRPRISEIRPRVPMSRRPRARGSRSLVAAANGGEFSSMDDLAAGFESTWSRLRAARSPSGSHLVASVRPDWPEDRILYADEVADSWKISAVLEGARDLDSLVAAGGICAPVDASYDMFGVGSEARPVRDSLPRFMAARGGVRFIPPPVLGDLDAGVTLWTEANDESPSDPATKSVVTVSCPDAIEQTVSAISLRIQTGNFRRLFFPEQFRRWFQLGMAAHARRAERVLLDRFASNSIDVTDGQNVGAARDLLTAWGRAGAQYRSRHRMDPDAVLMLYVPAWGLDMIREDLALQHAGDNSLGVADAQIAAYLAARHLRPVFYLDTETGEAQTYATQGVVGDAEAALQGWSASVVSYMHAPGSFIHLDGGQLDLGIDVRSPTLNDTNDVQSFFETFEEAAFVGVESLKITNTVCVSGEASAAVDAYTCPTSGS